MHERIKALREIAEKAAARQGELLELCADRPWTAEEQKEFDDLTAKADKALADIVPLQQVAERAAKAAAVQIPAAPVQRDATGVIERVARPAAAIDAPDHSPEAEAARVFANPKDPDAWKKELGAYAWSVAKNKAVPRFTPLEHLQRSGCQILVDKSHAEADRIQREAIAALGNSVSPTVLRGLNSLSGQGGDNMIMTPLSSEFIEFLRAESAFMRGGPNIIPMPLGSLDMSGGNAGAAGTYHTENADLGYTQATTRKINMRAKHIGAITALGNYAIEISPLAIPAIFGDDLANGIMQGIDSAGLRGDGTGQNPAGLLTLTAAAHKVAATNLTAPTVAQIDADVKPMMTKLDASLVPKRRRRWLMASRTFRYLQFMRDGISGYVFPGLHLEAPVWYDNIPVIVSDLIPVALGVGTNESELYLVDFGHVLMGNTRSLTLKASQEASYKNAGGTLVSAFSLDETVIRAMASHDFDMRHDKAAAILTALKWGA
jgi:HK97 family phage major capsid protein